MIDDKIFVQQSLINNLFYLRTLRTFALNIALSFFENNKEYINTASNFGKKFEEFGEKTIDLAQNRLSEDLLNSDIFVTPYTLDSELLTEQLFNIDINTQLTEAELNLRSGNDYEITQPLIDEIRALNMEIYIVTKNFIDFMNTILNQILSNETFSYSYPLFYQHAILESILYLEDLDRLINNTKADPVFIAGFQYYYLQVMKWQSQFIAGLVNPEQKSIIDEARSFENEFQLLINQYNDSQISPEKILIFNENALELVQKFKFFLATIIERVLLSKLNFIVEPVFLDNLLTEANYFIYLLKGSNVGLS